VANAAVRLSAAPAAVLGERPRRRRDRAWTVVAGAGLVLSAVYALSPSPAVSGLAWLVVGAGTVAALLVGPRVHRSRLRAPWVLMSVSAALFMVGALAREAVGNASNALWLPDLFTLPGYGVLLAGLLVLQRRVSHGGEERHALTDSLIVGLGAALLAVIVFALPAAAVPGRPTWLALLAATYPLVDVVVLLVLVHLAFTTAVRQPAFWLLVLMTLCLFVGDVGYAWIGTHGELVGPLWLNVPFVVGYVALAAAALHPSMAALSEAHSRPVQAWSAARLAIIVPALATAPVLLLVSPPATTVERAVYAVVLAGTVALLLVRAVSAVAHAARTQRVLVQQANHDPLTGLANRRLLLRQVNRMVGEATRTGRTVTLLFLDLDEFKLVNDLWGHEMGDALLVEVARRLSGPQYAGALAARIGGDEFVLAGLDDRGECGVRLAERVLADFVEPFALPVGGVVVTSSIGIASARPGQAGTRAEDMLRDADIAMYRAKKLGRNRYVQFDAAMREVVRHRAETESSLRHALDRDELTLHYQPIVDLRTEAVVGYEALLRWHHPQRGPVAPMDFIPVAEDTGLIVDIGAWVLAEAVDQLAAFQAAGQCHVSIAVNVSARQLRDERLVAAVAAALERSQVPPQLLHLEITESAMMDDPGMAERTLNDLRALGVVLSVDDFGTGYSALAYLTRFPVGVVKVDRGFVSGLGRDSGDEEIVRAVVAMAHSLGLDVVAEGVETREQRDMVRLLGADRAQGWLYGRPVPGSLLTRVRSSSTSDTVGRPALPAAVGESS